MKKRAFAYAAAAALSLTLCFGTYPASRLTAGSIAEAAEEASTIANSQISTNQFKNINYNNPISPAFFCADPTAVEYNGRLYLFGTNDHQQFEVKGSEVDNTYEQIKSLVVLSTDDMVNWTYHGEIHVDQVAPWITNSWAPSIVSRVEDDGLTHFYLYFSNNGLGVGVITATDPLGPWTDPLGKPLISTSTPGLNGCPNPFDPGAVIDENGVGWLSFGAGKAPGGTDYMPGSARIVRLGEDMVSFDSDFQNIPAPYLFEASELNYINGTYVYTYNTDWSDHSKQWEYDCDPPSGCSMVYMTTKTPLDPDSWVMRGECFQNPGQSGFDYSNNHTHMQKFRDQYYMFYHTLMLKQGMGIKGSYRSMQVDRISVDEDTVTITKTGGTKKGVQTIQGVDPFAVQNAASLNNTADMVYNTDSMQNPYLISDAAGAWSSVRSVTFTGSRVPAQPTVDPADYVLTKVDTITYQISVTDVDKATTLSMHPSTKAGTDCTGTAEITGTGNYTITCDMGGAEGMSNMGYFTASDDAQITFTIDTMLVNGTYAFDLSTELTNTREWADGLRNIWNGFSDGDTVYTGENAAFRYSKSADTIQLYTGEASGGTGANAPLLEDSAVLTAEVRGTGTMEVRLDAPTGQLLTSVSFDAPDAFAKVSGKAFTGIGGTHDLYFVFSGKNIAFRSWQVESIAERLMGDVNADGVCSVADVVALQKYLIKQTDTLADSKAGDYNGDGVLTGMDLVRMKRALLG